MQQRNSAVARLLSAQEVAERLSQPKEKLILLDVRTPEEWISDGRIEGATLIPIEEIEERAAQELPQDAEIITYCHVGARSHAVAQWLVQMGYTRVSDLAGGIESWQSAGHPVIRG